MADLDQISRAIGRLEAYNHEKHHTVTNMAQKMDAMHANLTKQIQEVDKKLDLDVSELKTLKAKGAGILLGVSAVSGILGSKSSAILHLIGNAFK